MIVYATCSRAILALSSLLAVAIRGVGGEQRSISYHVGLERAHDPDWLKFDAIFIQIRHR